MLFLVRANAPGNIQNPEFQQDMLEAVDDALARMAKVQERLDMLQAEIAPASIDDFELQPFLQARCRQIGRHLGNMAIDLNCASGIHLQSDARLLSRILENLLLNAREANGDAPAAQIAVSTDAALRLVSISITDNGPGIEAGLLPNALFEPLKTTKPHGSGIGLWLVKRLVSSLNGTIQAENPTTGGARFTIQLPL